LAATVVPATLKRRPVPRALAMEFATNRPRSQRADDSYRVLSREESFL
jgi:hypothetical protein